MNAFCLHLATWARRAALIAALSLLPFSLGCSARELRSPSFENSPRLEQILRARLDGDRTGACFAAAVVERGKVERAYVCAQAEDENRIGPDAAFEIGSVAKTMTAALLADLILEGKASLDDPLEALLPEGIRVPTHEGLPILLRHVVTHTSALPRLPPRFMPADMSDPYAAFGVDDLFATLGEVELHRAPGASYEYSNYATMLLSYAVGERAGSPFDELVRDRLFEPLGMEHAYVSKAPPGVRAARGHNATGEEVPAWNIAPALAGVGGVRATLDDMVAYVEAHLGFVDAPIAPALRLTHEILWEGTPRVAMNWHLARTSRVEALFHTGGTGGFSSFVAFDPRIGRGVIVLSDTNLIALGGLDDVGVHLLDPSFPLGKPRK